MSGRKLTRSGFNAEHAEIVLRAYGSVIALLMASDRPSVLAKRMKILAAMLMENSDRLLGIDTESEAMDAARDALIDALVESVTPGWRPGDAIDDD